MLWHPRSIAVRIWYAWQCKALCCRSYWAPEKTEAIFLWRAPYTSTARYIHTVVDLWIPSILRDRNWRPEEGEWQPIKISSKFETSGYVPKSPQALEPRSARIAMDKLSRSRRPRSQRGSKDERNFSNRSAALTDRWAGLVWPVGQFKFRQTGLTGLVHRSDRCRPENPQTNLQTTNLEQTKSKSNQTWRKAS